MMTSYRSKAKGNFDFSVHEPFNLTQCLNIKKYGVCVSMAMPCFVSSNDYIYIYKLLKWPNLTFRPAHETLC